MEKVWSVTDGVLSGTDKGLSAIEKVLSVAEKVLSAADKGLSVIEKVLSAADKALSVTEKVLSAADKGLFVTEKVLSAADKALSVVEKVLSVIDKTLSVGGKPACTAAKAMFPSARRKPRRDSLRCVSPQSPFPAPSSLPDNSSLCSSRRLALVGLRAKHWWAAFIRNFLITGLSQQIPCQMSRAFYLNSRMASPKRMPIP